MNSKKSFHRAFFFLVASSLTLAGCDVFSGLANPSDSGAAFVRFVEPVNGTIDLSLYATGAGRNAYVVFTTGESADAATPSASLKSVSRTSTLSVAGRVAGVAEKASEERRAAFRTAMESFVPVPAPRFMSTGDPSFDAPGQTKSFTLYGDTTTTNAVCKYVSGSVDFGGRSRSLSIWVESTEWSDSDTANGKVTPEKISALANSFFNADQVPVDSIYEWVTNMLGDEWGPEGSIKYGNTTYNTIGETNNITILLADIENDTTDFLTQGGIVGYFYPGDTIPTFSYSNERVMFTIDSVMLGTKDDTTWDLSDYWPREVISTLAHEFQHLIHYYQKGVVAGADLAYEPTWIDELCSMQVEDLIADKMGVPGPRGIAPEIWSAGSPGITSGRIVDYLYYPDISLDDWGRTDIYASYAAAYAFGAYLTRNYGGAAFIRSVVQSPFASANSIIMAAEGFSGRDESMGNLLRRWGAAVLLSQRMDAPEFYRYNTGTFFASVIGDIEYKLGSVNFYNFTAGIDSDGDDAADFTVAAPFVYSALNIDQLYGGAYSNAFMTLGNPADRPGWLIKIPEGMYATIVID